MIANLCLNLEMHDGNHLRRHPRGERTPASHASCGQRRERRQKLKPLGPWSIRRKLSRCSMLPGLFSTPLRHGCCGFCPVRDICPKRDASLVSSVCHLSKHHVCHAFIKQNHGSKALHLSVRPSIPSSIRPSVRPSVRLSVRPPVFHNTTKPKLTLLQLLIIPIRMLTLIIMPPMLMPMPVPGSPQEVGQARDRRRPRGVQKRVVSGLQLGDRLLIMSYIIIIIIIIIVN